MSHLISVILDDDAFNTLQKVPWGKRSKIISSLVKEQLSDFGASVTVSHPSASDHSGSAPAGTSGAEANPGDAGISKDNGKHKDTGAESTAKLRPGIIQLQLKKRVRAA